MLCGREYCHIVNVVLIVRMREIHKHLFKSTLLRDRQHVGRNEGENEGYRHW